MSFTPKSIAEQVAEHLRNELLEGRWSDRLPGRDRLAAEFGVNAKTIETALRRLENDGILENPGKGRQRHIKTRSRTQPAPRRFAVLLSEESDRSIDFIVDLRHHLLHAGHDAFHADKSLVDLGMRPERIAKLVAGSRADAWIVLAASLEVLEWFSQGPVPAFALFGPMTGVRIAGSGPRKAPAIAEATRSLLDLGHRRIAMLVRPRRRLPVPGLPEEAFLNALKSRGISPTAYHLPDWEDNPERFHAMLDATFRVTPPTALIVDEAALFVAVMQFCLDRRLRVPEDLSLVCTDDDPAFGWCRRRVAHITWNRGPVLRRVLQWADQLGRGRTDVRQAFSVARFLPGDTIGPTPRRVH